MVIQNSGKKDNEFFLNTEPAEPTDSTLNTIQKLKTLLSGQFAGALQKSFPHATEKEQETIKTFALLTIAEQMLLMNAPSPAKE